MRTLTSPKPYCLFYLNLWGSLVSGHQRPSQAPGSLDHIIVLLPTRDGPIMHCQMKKLHSNSRRYSAMKQNEVLMYVMTWIESGNTLLERIKTKTTAYYRILLNGNLKASNTTETEGRLVTVQPRRCYKNGGIVAAQHIFLGCAYSLILF